MSGAQHYRVCEGAKFAFYDGGKAWRSLAQALNGWRGSVGSQHKDNAMCGTPHQCADPRTRRRSHLRNHVVERGTR